MYNDNAFAVFALILIAGVASVITASVMAGFSTLPAPLTFLEHVALSLGFRAAYKGFGGFDWSDWAVVGMGGRPTRAAAHAGSPAEATS